MKPETKFKFKVYLTYLFIEPWSEKFSLPNLRTTIWILILVAFFLKLELLLFLFIIIGTGVYLVREFKSGKFIYWYRKRKYSERRKALKKIKEEKKNEKEKEEKCNLWIERGM